MPNLIVVLVLFIGLFIGNKTGAIFGIIFGILIDLNLGKTIGVTSVLLAIIGLLGEYLDKNFEIFNNIESNQYYVQMAVAWAVSIYLIKYYDETIKYLKSSKCKLDNFTYNKSLQKARESYRISKEQKEELQKMKR